MLAQAGIENKQASAEHASFAEEMSSTHFIKDSYVVSLDRYPEC